jgi:alpha-D-xyloside xylohydrolase
MNKLKIALFFWALQTVTFFAFAQQRHLKQAASGVLDLTCGAPDKFTPYSFCTQKPMETALAQMPAGKLPFNINDIRIRLTDRGAIVEIPLADDEQLYGFGLQQGSFNQRGLRKKPIVNDNPLNDLGYTHAPETFYVSTRGYGILINTARYTTFYCGSSAKLNNGGRAAGPKNALSVQDLYQTGANAGSLVAVDIPGAKGIEIFIFTGPDMKSAVERYNLFSGGGAMPAIWGLGIKYRAKADFSAQQVSELAGYFRANHIPIDVIGLEPKWQTASYSCSYVWNTKLYPDPQRFIDTLKAMNLHVNLWEHAFTAKTSPLYEKLKDKAGDYLVWNGLVPDFADTAAARIFADYHKNTFVLHGISGFKMDECDNSNQAFGSGAWSFPDLSQFPSGIDGEKMHQVFGTLYQKTIFNIYKKLNQRTYQDVRSLNAFASSYPVSLYSDTYDHKEYIRMIVNSGFGGLLWSPEVRESHSVNELMRRTQTAVLSAQTLFNCWYLAHPSWLQIDVGKNNKNILLDSAKQVEADIKTLLNYRMSLLPYLYNAFAEYRFKGTPPFRALVMDYPADKNTWEISNEYLIGDGLLAAPLTGDSDIRKVYLPAGTWYDFNTNKKYAGGQEYTIKNTTTQLPVFIKEGTILPLAQPVEYVAPDTKFVITCYVYGPAARGSLFEDDGITYNFDKGSYNTITLTAAGKNGHVTKTGDYKGTRYVIKDWKFIE